MYQFLSSYVCMKGFSLLGFEIKLCNNCIKIHLYKCLEYNTRFSNTPSKDSFDYQMAIQRELLAKIKDTYVRGESVGRASFLVFFVVSPIHEPIRNITADKSFGNIAVTSFSHSGTLNISVRAAHT